MRNILGALFALMLISSCSRENDNIPKPLADPVLKRTVQTNTSGAVVRVSYYNEMELVTFDTAFQSGTQNPGMINVYTYNTKGKLSRREYSLPVLYTAGVYWDYLYSYQDDTLPTITYRYFKGNQVAHITHFYNASRRLIMDSTYHTPNYGTFTYLTKYEYDMSGRLISSLELNDSRDTTAYTTYRYAPNRVEKSVINFFYNPAFRVYSQAVTEYTASGKILSEKTYGGETPQLSSQTDYTYDADGHLLKKTTLITTGSTSEEERYFNNSITGKPEKMEYYLNNQLSIVTTYYYE